MRESTSSDIRRGRHRGAAGGRGSCGHGALRAGGPPAQRSLERHERAVLRHRPMAGLRRVATTRPRLDVAPSLPESAARLAGARGAAELRTALIGDVTGPAQTRLRPMVGTAGSLRRSPRPTTPSPRSAACGSTGRGADVSGHGLLAPMGPGGGHGVVYRRLRGQLPWPGGAPPPARFASIRARLADRSLRLPLQSARMERLARVLREPRPRGAARGPRAAFRITKRCQTIPGRPVIPDAGLCRGRDLTGLGGLGPARDRSMTRTGAPGA